MPNNNSTRKIIHIDMDCFYAAVEMRDNPQWRDKPLAVGGDASRRGVLATCNYQARRYGLHSAMPTAHAKRLCPDLILAPVNMEKYRQTSQTIRTIFSNYSDCIEPLSLDEAYLDVSDSPHCQGSATRIAQAIRRDIFAQEQLTASAGIASNKFLAKVASDWRKPNGQFVITPAQIQDFMHQLAVKKIPGVGKVTAEKLAKLGVTHCEQLQQWSQQALIDKFGKFGGRLYLYCRGIDEREVESARVRKSVSVETTFVQDLAPSAVFDSTVIDVLFEKLQRRLQGYDDAFIHKQFVKIKFADFSLASKECVVSGFERVHFNSLLARLVLTKSVRLLGLGVRFAKPDDGRQMDLFC